jgi:Tfp pilus assembly protein PilO
MNRLSRSEKILLTLLAVVLVSYVYYQFIMAPTLQKVTSAKVNISQLQSELDQLRLLAVGNKSLEEDIKEYKVKYEEYVNTIPREEREPQILRDLKLLIDNNDLKVTSVNIGIGIEYVNSSGENAAAAMSNLKTMAVPLSINFSGGYSDVMNFMKNLEESNRLTVISSVDMTSQEEGENKVLSISLNANVIYISDGSSAERQYEFNNNDYGKDNPFN